VYPELKNVLFNLTDSEYSFATGNSDEFLNERMVVVDELVEMAATEPSLKFFLPFLVEDLILGYCLAKNAERFVLPARVFRNRFMTNPLLSGKLKPVSHNTWSLEENLFTLATEETLAEVKTLINSFKSDPVVKRTVEHFMSLVAKQEDMEDAEDEEVKGVVILCGAKCQRAAGQNAEEALQRYDELQALLQAEQQKFDALIQAFKKAYQSNPGGLRRNLLNSKASASKNQLSYSALHKMLEASKRTGLFQKVNRLHRPQSQSNKLLRSLNELLAEASALLQQDRVISEAHQLKVRDLVELMLRASDLEDKIIEDFLAVEEANVDRMQDFEAAVADLHESLNEVKQSAKYVSNKSTIEKEKLVAERELNERMEKIRGKIYMSYNKTKTLSRQIYSLKKKVSAGTK
jgi:hypothetical protein